MAIARLMQAVRGRLGHRHGLAHSVGTLVGGTAIAQALTILALPLLTRLYTPADFSLLAVYASLLAILSAIACLRLEIAIPLPDSDRDAASLLVASLVSTMALSLIVGLLTLEFHEWIIEWLGVPEFGSYLWMVPIGMLTTSSFAAIQFWATRKKRFARIAKTRVAQATGGTAVQTGFGVVGVGPIGLLLGQMISGGIGFIGLAREAWRSDKKALRSVTLSSISGVLRRYERFPKYSTFEALANTAGIQVPVIVIAALALGPEAGYLMIATRLMAAPMSLVGGSIAQVYLAHAADELRAGQLGDFTARILVGLIKTGVGPLIFAGVVSGPLAGIVFGKEWTRAGELVGWMTPWFILQFLASPVSMVMHVTGRQRQMLAVTLVGLTLRLGAMWVAYSYFKNGFSEIYAISGALFYGLCCFIFYHASGMEINRISSTFRNWASPLSAWLLSGLAMRYVIGIAL